MNTEGGGGKEKLGLLVLVLVLGECRQKRAAASLSPPIVCLFFFFPCQLGKTKVELNEANEEAPHLALLL